ncbi:hypothetical protein TNCT_93281 [Trichonephila clavata]|uniref:Uncharacterized protein n=1 Tax=Trichonephila clavata TaxID=2740835 RepID=A0A8X6LP60_TRICU|nr:hypothetical protein TNCT_93281 [Trichonephila clavata]
MLAVYVQVSGVFRSISLQYLSTVMVLPGFRKLWWIKLTGSVILTNFDFGKGCGILKAIALNVTDCCTESTFHHISIEKRIAYVAKKCRGLRD